MGEDRTVTIQEVMRRGNWKSKGSIDMRMKKLDIEPTYVNYATWAPHRIMLTEEEAVKILNWKK